MAFVYSCCFWFSLRLAGIIIGVFSMMQGLLVLTALSIAQENADIVYERLSIWMQQTDLSFTQPVFESILNGLQSYISSFVTLDIIYLILCIAFIFGAYKCSNMLMLGYLVAELFRLVWFSALLVAWLMVLKKNTMDIGLLIGASIAGGFTLLGMFYLWVCCVNLPILINEMEREEQLETIQQLQRQLEQRSQRRHHNVDMDELMPAFPAEPALPDIYAPERKNTLRGFARNDQRALNTITSNFNSGYWIGSRDFVQ